MHDHGATSKTVRIDLSGDDLPDLDSINFDRIETVVLSIPLPSFGVTNSHIDLCADLLDASWALEKLALYAESIEAEVISENEIKAVLTGIRKGFTEVLGDCCLAFGEPDCPNDDQYREIQRVRDEIADFEDNLPDHEAAVPGVVDWYFADLMAALGELKYEAPEYWREVVGKFPEYGVYFFKSAYSARLGGDCYASPDGWILPANVDVDAFFKATGQTYRFDDFMCAEIFSYGNQHFLISQDVLAHLSMNNLLQSRACAGIVRHRTDDDSGPFEWVNDIFPGLAMGLKDFRFRQVHSDTPCIGANDEYLIHPSGTLAIVRDSDHLHLIYGTTPITHSEMKWLSERMTAISSDVSSITFGPVSINCNWTSLSDEDFEQLCYDIIYDSPQFDSKTIRKLGKSRSRDGGRDIEVYETTRWPGDRFKKKWIIQCKLVKGSASLGAAKVADVGDMLERYSAQGFGVFTSTTIDATLYDKLDDICGRRGVDQMHKSVHELERELARNARLRDRYFPSK